ncbi:adenylate kinase [Nematocida major]|uniref:adenylate kinase n=1 Tax=Nematocida major TaxID=1912982 RepID=UPI002007D5EB|nr:adenylate kinase [Nematocida major]KAH9387467.1 adenylate kinase [Nematocida major]
MCRLLMVGPPLAGKGTQCKILAKTLDIKHISSGDILREEMQRDTELAHYIRAQLNSGQFVSDEVIRGLVNARVKEESGGFILDGYPRTEAQLRSIDFPYDRILFLDTPMEYIMDRVEGRLCHAESGRIYHTKYNPPKVPGRDDVTGDLLVRRGDDKVELIKGRILDFIEKTGKVIEAAVEANTLTRIDGSLPKEEISRRILEAVGKSPPKK